MDKLTDDATKYICDEYDIEPEHIRIDGESVHVTATMPGTNQHGEFFAGYLKDLEAEAARDLEEGTRRHAWKND